jgi:hypothetical protein
LILFVETDEDDRFYCLEELTGDLLPVPDIRGAWPSSFSHWTGDRLIIDTMDGFQIHRWTE